jgi:hypothetical protein
LQKCIEATGPWEMHEQAMALFRTTVIIEPILASAEPVVVAGALVSA